MASRFCRSLLRFLFFLLLPYNTGLIPAHKTPNEKQFFSLFSPATLIFSRRFGFFCCSLCFFLLAARSACCSCACSVRLPDDYFWLLNCGWFARRVDRGVGGEGAAALMMMGKMCILVLAFASSSSHNTFSVFPFPWPFASSPLLLRHSHHTFVASCSSLRVDISERQSRD